MSWITTICFPLMPCLQQQKTSQGVAEVSSNLKLTSSCSDAVRVLLPTVKYHLCQFNRWPRRRLRRAICSDGGTR